MKTLNKTLIRSALVAASALALAPLANATPELEVAIGSGGCTTLKSTSSNGTLVWSGTDPSVHFTSIVASALGLPTSGPPDLLDSETVDAHSTGSGTLYLCITETGLTGPVSAAAVSSFASFELPTRWSVTETSYADAADSAFGTAETLGTHSFTSAGTSTAPSTLSFSAPFSLTEIYKIAAVGAGTTSDSIDISADITNVPEPATFALLAVGLLGTAIGLRRRRRS
jgi:hypothetical protein